MDHAVPLAARERRGPSISSAFGPDFGGDRRPPCSRSEAGVIPSPPSESRGLFPSCPASPVGRSVQNAASFSARGRDPREIGADPARMSTRSTRVERQFARGCAGLRGCGRSPRMPPSVDPRLRLVREADPGPNRVRMAVYRGGICAHLTHERGYMRLLSRLPRGRPGATSGANRAKQQRFSRRRIHVDGALATSSVHTRKISRVFGPNVVASATSVASRPRAMSTRPMRGTLFRGSNVCHAPPR